MRGQIGWEQVGGRAIREGGYRDMETAYNAGGVMPEVTGRTTWIDKTGPNGESGFWSNRPMEGGRVSEKGAHAALDKFAAGEKLNAKEQRFIDYAVETARHDRQAGMDEWESIKASNPDWVPGFDYEEPHVDYGDTVPFSRRAKDDATVGTDLFAAPTAAERNRAATEAKGAQRNGLTGGRADTGDGGLFDGPRPEQTSIPDAPAIGQREHDISQSGNPAPEISQSEPARNLRRFMAGSKVVDAGGKPLTVYHGTNEEFWAFDGNRSGAATAHSTSPLGHFFTERRGQAEHYARNAADGVPADERVIDAHLSIKHPAEWTMARMQRIDTPEEARRIRRNLEKSGFDGIHIKEAGQWIAFKPEQIKSASANRGTFDAANPDMRFSTKADDSIRGRLPGDHVGRGKLDVGEVNRIASRILGVDAERAGVHVVPDFGALPPELQQRSAKQGAQVGDINAVHWKGESWILASEMRDAAHVAEMIFHEHYTHGGLRAQYDKELGPKLDSLLEGVGGVDGVQRMAREQGIDLSEYEKANAANPRMSEQNKRRVLMEELLAHMSKATGTLKRVLQEWWGMLREWLRRHGLAELAKYNVTDMARVLREARQAAQSKMAGDAREPFFQRAWHGTPHRGIEKAGFKLEKIGTGEGN